MGQNDLRKRGFFLTSTPNWKKKKVVCKSTEESRSISRKEIEFLLKMFFVFKIYIKLILKSNSCESIKNFFKRCILESRFF